MSSYESLADSLFSRNGSSVLVFVTEIVQVVHNTLLLHRNDLPYSEVRHFLVISGTRLH